jgi:NitT/TauT family transport system substrate-binding protein
MSDRVAAPNGHTRGTFLRRAGAGVGALMLPGLVSACGDDDSGGGSGASKGKTETVVDQLGWLKLTQWGGYFAADAKGYYGKQGIKAQFLAGGPNVSAWQTLAAGRSVVCQDDPYGSVVEGIVKGAPLVAIGTTFQSSPYACMSLESNPIDSVEAMKGKTVAVGASNRTQVVSILKEHGLSESDVKLVPGGPDPTQLVTKQADGYFGFFTSQGVSLQAQGLKIKVLTLDEMGVPSYSNLVWVQKKTLDSKKDMLVGYMKASIQGWEYCNAHPDEVAALTVKSYAPAGTKLKSEVGTAKLQKSIVEGPKGVMQIDEEKFQGMLDSLLQQKIISKPLKAKDVMTTEILDEAYQGKTSLSTS